jgi:hypothetical protein
LTVEKKIFSNGLSNTKATEESTVSSRHANPFRHGVAKKDSPCFWKREILHRPIIVFQTIKYGDWPPQNDTHPHLVYSEREESDAQAACLASLKALKQVLL